MAKLSTDSKLKDILKNPKGKEVYEKIFPGSTKDPQIRLAYGMTIKSIAEYAPDRMPKEKLEELDKALSEIE